MRTESQTDSHTHTHTHTEADDRYTHATTVSVSNIHGGRVDTSLKQQIRKRVTDSTFSRENVIQRNAGSTEVKDVSFRSGIYSGQRQETDLWHLYSKNGTDGGRGRGRSVVT